MTSSNENPAEVAAKESIESVIACIESNQNFVLEAGAGAGKTYSLIVALKHLIRSRGADLCRSQQKIACITYTNVAKDEIRNRIDNHPAVIAETIHSFSWSLLKDFQPNIRSILPSLGKWQDRIAEQGELGNKKIIYDLGYPKVGTEVVSLHHDDVLSLMTKLMDEPKFRSIFHKRFPILFIDEYQDTEKSFVESLKTHFIEESKGPLIGFFGDHWQKIYGSSSCGLIEHRNLKKIDKRANFRSEKKIVDSLNRIRPALPQQVSNPLLIGEVTVFHTNNWVGTRRTGGHWAGDLPAEEARNYLSHTRDKLSQQNWVFQEDQTKILMLTHSVLSEEQGYQNLAAAFNRTDSYIKKEDSYISFFVDMLEPLFSAYEKRKFGQMNYYLGTSGLNINAPGKKEAWLQSLETLKELRAASTIGQIIAHLSETKLPRLPEKIVSMEQKFTNLSSKSPEERDEEEVALLDRLTKLKAVRYSELIALSKFIEDKTPFATKHGVKGAEFENVLIVFGRGWNQYNFNQMLEWAKNGAPADKQDAFERNRNLFYVACSRPKKRLALLFTQQLSADSIATLERWFESASVHALPNLGAR